MQKRTQPTRADLVQLIPRLRRYACVLVGQTSDADDLAQATLEKLLVKGLPEGSDVTKWAFRVCRNLWIDEMRAKSVRTRLAPEIIRGQDLNEDGERVVMAKLDLQDVSNVIDTLPEEQRSALALVTLEGYTYAEAAKMLDVSTGTIMSRIHRARQKVSEAMEQLSTLSPRKQGGTI